MKTHSQKFIQKRKFIMALPVLVLPFLTMFFWALGGGSGVLTEDVTFKEHGLNFELPDAHFDEEVGNKLALYEKAARDSAKFREDRENDPYFNLETLHEQYFENDSSALINEIKTRSSAVTSNLFGSKTEKAGKKLDPNEEKVTRKLDELVRELNKPQVNPPNMAVEETKQVGDPQFSNDINKLEKMMDNMHSKNQSDPEMEKIGGMLDKILDIQHPDRARDRIREESRLKKGTVYPVSALKEEDNISIIGRPEPGIGDSSLGNFPVLSKMSNRFYEIGDDFVSPSQEPTAIEGSIHNTQELVAGSVVKIRLLSDIYLSGNMIPKDQFVYGICAINGERLTISINSIREGNSLFPVSLSAYDLDGIEGLYIPGAITRDAAKQSSDQAMQSMQFMTMDQSVGAQAASAGMQAAKGLFSKKVKLIKVTVKAGYRILLKDSNTK